MVGGYVVLTEQPLRLGDNNMVAVYGSLEAAVARFYEIARSGKPILLKYRSVNVLSAWLEFFSVSDGTFTLNSIGLIVTFNANTGVLNIAVRT